MRVSPSAARGGQETSAQPRAVDNELSQESSTPSGLLLFRSSRRRLMHSLLHSFLHARFAAELPFPSSGSAVPASAPGTSRCECGFARPSSQREPGPAAWPGRGLWLRRRCLPHTGEGLSCVWRICGISGFIEACSFCMMVFICVFCSSVRFRDLAKNPIVPVPHSPLAVGMNGLGAGASAAVCDLAKSCSQQHGHGGNQQPKTNRFHV